MNFKLLSLLTAVAIFGFVSCTESKNETLSVDLSGLENLGSDYAYEGWIMVDGTPESTGVFTVNDNGDLSTSSFDVENLEEATAFILTIEPSPDNDPAPSKVHLVAGDFNGDSANLSVGHSAAIADDLSTMAGGFILATPTDNDMTNEASGIWFLDNSSGMPEAALELPTLPEGWIYEGWAVIDGTPVTTGKFSSASGADDAAPYSGTDNPGPAYPGEDFLLNGPSGLSFPTDLKGGTGVISIEPVPDNSPNPFLLKPLVQAIELTAADHTFIAMTNNASNTNPSGSVTRK